MAPWLFYEITFLLDENSKGLSLKDLTDCLINFEKSLYPLISFIILICEKASANDLELQIIYLTELLRINRTE